MDMNEIFCSNQIVIPPILPSVLKKYAKAAIRTQPYDLLVWTAAYFRAMAKGTPPPVKPRLEFPLPEQRQLSIGYIRLLVYQFGRSGEVCRVELTQKWNDVCLPPDVLYNVLRLGYFAHTVDLEKFIAITIGFLEETLKGTMLRFCEVMTEEPEGGSAMIPCHTFLSIYKYLGEMDCGKAKTSMLSEDAPTSEKQPCIPEEQGEDSITGKDIDSVIREIGDAESTVSVDTRLEGIGMELDWPNLECKNEGDGSILRFPSEPSDEGATSKYGIEVMTELDTQKITLDSPDIQKVEYQENLTDEDRVLPKTKGEIKVLYEETRKALPSEKDSEITDETELERDDYSEELATSITLPDLLVTSDKNTLDQNIKKFLEQAKEATVSEEDEELSEVGSVRIILDEKEGEESESVRDSLFSENKKPLTDLDHPEGVQRSMSLSDVRATLDRDLRRKNIDNAIFGKKKQKLMELQAEAEAKEKQHIEEEAKKKFHMHVPGIGPTLPEDLMNKVEVYLICCAERQANMVMPRNIRHFLCPPLDFESLIQTKELASLLDETTQMPELKQPSILRPDMVEVIQKVEGFDFESLLDSSLSRSSVSLKELSNLSERGQAFGRTTSLHFLLNQEKNPS